MNAGKQAVLFEQAPAGQTIPFGKYKDQPVEILLTDPDYVTWLRATMGEKLKNQYPLVLNYIVAHYGEPSRTPDHNALQNRFLKREFQIQFALAVTPGMANWVRLEGLDLNALFENEFARREADAVKFAQNQYSAVPSMASKIEAAVDKARARIQKDKAAWRERGRLAIYTGTPRDGVLENPVKVSGLRFEENGADVVYRVDHSWSLVAESKHSGGQDDVVAGCREVVGITVQIKPVLGDDYPAVLRAMKAVKTKFLLVRDYTGIGATWGEVKQVFALDAIRAVLLEDVERVHVPESFNRIQLPRF
jgi:hypothetical protein